MARQTTKKKVETPEARADEFERDALIRELRQTIKNLKEVNEQLSHELSEARNK